MLLAMRSSLLIVLCTQFVLGTEATCYLPNGNAPASGGQFPCNSAAGVESMCCNTQNTTNPGRCTKDGLCVPYTNDNLWRGQCTDPTWNDPACLHICTVGQGKKTSAASINKNHPIQNLTPVPDLNGTNYADINAPLVTCADGTWCCGFQADDGQCCTAGKGVTIVDGKVVTPQANAPTSSSVPKSSASTAQIPSASSSTSPKVASAATSLPKNASSNIGSIVGGAVGGCAGVVTLAFVFWYSLIRRNTNRPSPPLNYASNQTGKEELWQLSQEVPTQEIRRELDSTQARQELALHPVK